MTPVVGDCGKPIVVQVGRGSQIPPSADLPPSQTTARPDNQRVQDHRTEPRRRLGGVGFHPTVARLTLRSATSSADFRIVFHW